MSASITVSSDPSVRYVLRLADTCLILSHRLSEWCGHAPALEEDIALANMALDLLGQARSLLAHAATLEGSGRDEDALAYLRDERDVLNPTIVELPRGDFAFTVLRNAMLSTWLGLLWQRLEASSDPQLAAIAAKAVKEARYHRRHAADWVVRLGDGSDESARRMRDALASLWPYAAELFENDAVDAHAAATGLGPRWSELHDAWLDAMRPLLAEACLAPPPDSAFRSEGRRGRHSEHMGYIVATMQHLHRAYPAGVW